MKNEKIFNRIYKYLSKILDNLHKDDNMIYYLIPLPLIKKEECHSFKSAYLTTVKNIFIIFDLIDLSEKEINFIIKYHYLLDPNQLDSFIKKINRNKVIPLQANLALKMLNNKDCIIDSLRESVSKAYKKYN